MKLEEAVSRVRPLDRSAMQRAQRRWDSIAKPLGGLGVLEEMLVQIAGVTGDEKLEQWGPAAAVFCADHGVVAEGVTQCGSEVTAAVAGNMARGQASVCLMAQAAGAKVYPVDVGMASDVAAPGLLIRKTAYGTADFVKGPAMTREQAVQSLEAGIEIARLLASKGHTLLAVGEMGIGNTTAASALAAVLLDREPYEVTGYGAGLSEEGLRRKVEAIEAAIVTNRPDPSDPMDILCKLGGLEIAAMAGFFIGGGVERLPVLMDGVISSVAALCAVRLCPALEGQPLASHRSREPASAWLLEALGAHAAIDAGMRLGEGSGAVAAMPLLEMARRVYRGMPTFAESAIEEYRPL